MSASGTRLTFRGLSSIRFPRSMSEEKFPSITSGVEQSYRWFGESLAYDPFQTAG